MAHVHPNAPQRGHDPRTEIPEIPEIHKKNGRVNFSAQLATALRGIDKAEDEFIAFEEKRLHHEGPDRDSHYDPRIRREHKKVVNYIRLIHARAARLRSVFTQLNPNNALHVRWLHAFFYMTHLWHPETHDEPDNPRESWSVAWRMDEEFSTPEGIPDPVLTREQASNWLLNSYVLSETAQLELEISCNGLAPLVLEAELTKPYDDGRVDPDNINRNRKRNIKRSRERVARYLDYYQRQRIKREAIPDLYSELSWGHDTRLKELKLLVTDGSQFIELTPEFDPEVLEYTTTQAVTSTRVSRIDYFDPLMSYISNVSISHVSNTRLTVTVTANDGTSKRVYTINKVAE